MLERATIALCLLFSLEASAVAFDQSAAHKIDERFRDKWSAASVDPQWSSPNQFWYRRPLAGQGEELVLVDCASGTQEVVASDAHPKDTQPAWRPEARQRHARARRMSPDGKWRVEAREHNLWLKNRETGEEQQLTTDGVEGNDYEGRVYWSPDSTSFVAMQTKAGGDRRVHLIESSPGDQLQPKLDSYHYLKPGDDIPLRRPKLFRVDEVKEIAVSNKLFDNPWEIGEVRWDPESEHFTCYYNERGHQVARVLKVDAATGDVQVVVEDKQPTFIDYAHKHFAYYLDDTDELVWMSERDGWNHLYLVDLESGDVKNPITQGEWVVRGVDFVDPEKREIWFRASGIHPEQDPYYIHHCRIGFDGQGLVVMTAGDGNHRITYSPDREYLVDTYSRVDLPPVVELRKTSDGSLVKELEQSDLGSLEALGWRAPERFVAKARDGETDIYGVIFRPTEFDESRKYPIVEDLYAGPHGSFVPKDFYTIHNQQRLAELGFIVVQIDGLGTSNRSKKFQDVAAKNLVDAGLPDRKLWMKAAAEQYPQMDLSRVGVMGHSAGAQSAMAALLWHGDFYKVAVSSCGCHDNRMDKIWWNELWMGWPIGPHYAEQSNVTNAHRLEGKLFLIVGELDKNVDPASTMQVVNALINAEKDFEFLVVPGRGHDTFTPYVDRRKRDFLMEHLHATSHRAVESTTAENH
ncbi:DPP IV N-terminal domain-containing protein [Aeoliella sp. SH292]|uniref:DPP IV N-terminal domain-containing protein n=1 Tax=Aeoliella sp. SH292 TaxID=3454464 RepID=UPI003F983BF6